MTNPICMNTNLKREAKRHNPTTSLVMLCGLWLYSSATLPAFSDPLMACSGLSITRNPGDGYYQLVVVQGPRGFINSFSFLAEAKAFPAQAPTIHVQVHTDLNSLSDGNVGIMKTTPLWESDFATNTVGLPRMDMRPMHGLENDCHRTNDYYLITAPIMTNSSVGTWFVFWIKTAGWVVPPLAPPNGMGLKVYQACHYQDGMNVWRYWFKPLPVVNGYYAPLYSYNYKPMLSATYISQTITMTWGEGTTNLYLSNGQMRIPVSGSSITLPATNAAELFWLEKQ